jgi:hypothetical protein
MTQTYKLKLAHISDDGDKLELHTFVDAPNYDGAFELAKARFQTLLTELSQQPAFDIDQCKIELGTHQA